MALWQFTTLAVLIGTLLVYASVITRRLGRVNARLNKIEEALLAKNQSIDPADTRAAGAETKVSGGNNRRGGYLTIRDLRVRSEPLSSHVIPSSSRNSAAVPGGREAPATSSEPLNPPAMRAVSEDPAATDLGSREAPVTNTDDSRAKKNRDMMLFLSSQRRRRRARLGY